MNTRKIHRQDDYLIESANAVLIDKGNGKYRCHKSRSTGVIKGGIYSREFIEVYAALVPDVIIVKEEHVI